MKEYTTIQLVKKLIGEIQPIGETNYDSEIPDRIQEYCDLIDEILTEMGQVSDMRVRYEYSMKVAGEKAYNARKYLLEHFFEDFKESQE